MSLLPLPENQAMDAFDLAQALDERETPMPEYLGAKVGEGWWYSLPGQGAAQSRASSDVLGVDEAAAGMSDFAAGRMATLAAARETVPVMDESSWKASPWYRQNLSWDRGMTDARAQAMADIADENTYRRWLIEQSPDGARSVAGFAAEMIGGGADPVNFVPFLGPASKAALAARTIRAFGPAASRIALPAAVHGVNAALGAAAASPVVMSSAASLGDDVGLADVAMDVAFGGAFGATFGAAGGAWRAWRERGAVSGAASSGQSALLSDAVAALARGESPSLRADTIAAVTEKLRAAVRDVDADPVGDPFRPLVELTSADLERVIVARGGFENINEMEVSRAGWGLVKVIWRHGWKSQEPARLQVTEQDILALPEILRTKSPIPDDSEPYRTWVVERDSAFGLRKIVYGVKRMDGDQHRTLVTIHVVDPKGRKRNIALSEDIAGGGLASPGEVSRPPRDTAAASSESGTQGQAGPPAGFNIGDSVTTVTGREIGVEYELVEAADLIASHGVDLERNPSFPPELQPRDRSRAASDEQIARIAADLRPGLLGRSAQADSGAPIVGRDGVVESGNGRVLAIRRAYAAGGPSANRYRSWLERQGFDLSGMSEPVLIRRRQGDMTMEERVAFAREANERGTMALSASERAMSDARILDADLVSLHRGGSLSSRGNSDFVRGFMERIAPEDRASLMDRDGHLSADGVRRIESAMLARAYDDPTLVSALAESPEPDIKTIGAVMTELAPRWILLREGVADGTLARDMDQTGALLSAVRMIRKARESGEKLATLAGQRDFFDPQSAELQAFLRIFYGETLSRAVGRDRLAVSLGRYVDDALHNVRGALFPARPAGELLDAARGLRPRNLEAVSPPERAPEPSPGASDASAATLARESGIDILSGDFDESVVLRQMEADGRLRPEDTAAVRQADDLLASAEEYVDALDRAAICLTRTP